MTTEQKFNAAVNVIRNLPKNGAYQPSHDLMLRFYSYYKQATEGPNKQQKPKFWEVVQKAKWDAWTKLGNMSREEAMINYVDELKKIVETMSYSDNVENFMTSLDSFYESVPAEDLQLVIGPVIEKVRSRPGSPLNSSPFASREASPERISCISKKILSSVETSPDSSHSVSPIPAETDEEDDFLDTIEQAEPEKILGKESSSNGILKNKSPAIPLKSLVPCKCVKKYTNSDINIFSQTNNSKCCNKKPQEAVHMEFVTNEIKRQEIALKSLEGTPKTSKELEISQVISRTLSSLERNVIIINARLDTLERNVRQVNVLLETKDVGFWPLNGIGKRSAILLILWPLVIQGIVIFFQRRRRVKVLSGAMNQK